MRLILHVRSWARRLTLGAVLLAAFYLLAANVFLLSSVGPSLISRRPERFRLTWQSAWSVWPGEVRFRGLEIRGNQPRVRWWITAEEGTARLDLPALLRREVRIEHLRATGVRSRTDRLPPPAGPAPEPPRRREPWAVRLERVELDGVRELGYGPWLLQGEGRMVGSFRLVLRREVELGPTTLAMPAGRLFLREGLVAREVGVRAELRLGPYSPREHRGVAGFDFLTGHLVASGAVPELSILEKIRPDQAAPVQPGRLAVDLRLDRGSLVSGSRLDFAAPGAERLVLSGEVRRGGVALLAETRGIALRRRDGSPLLEAGESRLAVTAAEHRLSRLIADARTLRGRPGQVASLPVPAYVAAADLRLHPTGRNVTADITARQVRGEIDLVALLARRVVLTDLDAEEVTLQVDRGLPREEPPSAEERQPWTFDVRDGLIERLSEVRIGDWRLSGSNRVAGRLTWDGQALDVKDAVVEIRDGRLRRGAEEIVRDLDARLAGALDPCAIRGRPALAVLDCARFTVRATAEVHRLRSLPALGAAGRLRTELRIERGLLRPGSFLELGSAVIATVEGGDEPRLVAEVRDLALGGGPDRPPVLRAAAARARVPVDDLHVGRLFTRVQDRSFPPVADLEASGLRLGGVGERIGWDVAIDRAGGRIDLRALMRREVLLSQVRGEGTRLEVRRTGQLDPRVPPPAGKPWTVRLDGRIARLREAALGSNRLLGNGRIEGTLEATFGGGARTCRLDRLALSFDSARIVSDRTPVARGISVLSELRIAPFTPGELRGASLFRLISGSLAVEGEISSLGFLRTYLRKAPWLVLDGRGHLSADLRLDAGRLQPGTRITVDPAEVEAEYLLSRAAGQARVQGLVVPGPGEPHLVLGVDFGRFRIAAREPWDAPAHVTGEGLQLSMTSSDLDLAQPGKNLLVRVVLPEADVRDLAFYNGYLPPGTGVSILEGTGRLGFDLSMEAASQTARGEVTLRSDAVRVRIEDLELAGALDLRTRLASPDLRKRRFDLAGTSLSLDRVVLRHVGPDAGPPRRRQSEGSWWARVKLESGEMEWARPLVLTSLVRLEMKEAGFLVSMLSRQKPYLTWFGHRLRHTPVEARGELRLAEGAIEVDPLEVLGGHFDIRSRLRLSRERRHGHLYVRWRRLALGVELEGRERSYRFLRPLEWFENLAWKR